MTGPRYDRQGFYLALDTSGSEGSVAIGMGEVALTRRLLPDRGRHAAHLVPAIRGVLVEAELDRSDLSGVVVGSGPGSFTGLRVAAATAKSIVHTLGIPLWAFSSLAAGAVRGGEAILNGHSDGPPTRTVLFDARGEKVFTATYRLEPGKLLELKPPRWGMLGEVLERTSDPSIAFCGDGAQRHRERILDEGFTVLEDPAGRPGGDPLLRLMALTPDRPPVEEPALWEPDYLRPSNAERGQ